MNWKIGLVVVAACSASGFGGAWLAMNRDVLPEALGGVEGPSAEPWVNEIVNRVDQLEEQNASLKESLTTAEERMTEIETVFVASGMDVGVASEQLERFRASLAETDSRLSKVDSGLSSTREELEEFRTEQEQQAEELKLEDFVFIDLNPINGVVGPHIIFQGVNVHIESGTGATDDFERLTGLGNLFIGYNEVGDGQRFGSHNLVVGPGHSYTSHGGFLAGAGNIIAGPNATVSGGTNNVASGIGSIVCGGETNTVTGDHASIAGGLQNEAEGRFASIIGGSSNVASGSFTNVTGGRNNRASGESTAVYGGADSHAQAALTAVLGSLGGHTPVENKVQVGGPGFIQPQQ